MAPSWPCQVLGSLSLAAAALLAPAATRASSPEVLLEPAAAVARTAAAARSAPPSGVLLQHAASILGEVPGLANLTLAESMQELDQLRSKLVEDLLRMDEMVKQSVSERDALVTEYDVQLQKIEVLAKTVTEEGRKVETARVAVREITLANKATEAYTFDALRWVRGACEEAEPSGTV
mmetsp:Transcript_86473/g.268681  ORF Transcript_86473/g.268681 Transcript_86473/m.268681 type:complete len:178 (-) Transcript_86473:2-535(-)